jgi:hypothetical protein
LAARQGKPVGNLDVIQRPEYQGLMKFSTMYGERKLKISAPLFRDYGMKKKRTFLLDSL